MTEPIRILTIRQPWCWAVTVAEGKPVENRSKPTKYRGLVAIHAATAWSERGQNDSRVRQLADTVGADRHAYALRHEVAYHHRPMWPFVAGAVVAVARIADCHFAYDDDCCGPWGETEYRRADGGIVRNIWHWVLEDRRVVEPPLGAKGRVGLMPIVDEDLLDALQPYLTAA